MQLRPATLEDIPAVLALIRRVVPAMRASGNLQWDDLYPNAKVFANDVAQQQLVADGHWVTIDRQELVAAGHWDTVAVAPAVVDVCPPPRPAFRVRLPF